MDDKRWWDIISAGCPRDIEYDGWGLTLLAVLVKLPPDDILAFDIWFDARTKEAYREDLWRAASLINGWSSDDGFHDFRYWLVGMGKKVYEAALRDPDSLADVTEPDTMYEWETCSIGSVAWAQVTGRSYEEFHTIREDMPDAAALELIPAGWENTPEELQRRFPRLWAKAGGGEEEE